MFYLTQPQENLFEPNTFFYLTSFCTISTNLLDLRAFGVTEYQPHPYWSTPIAQPSLST